MYSLWDFINIPFLENAKLMTTHDNLANVEIMHISVMEHPVENFTRPKELILTTAINCYENINTFLDFVKEVYLSKAAALVISRKKDPYFLPPEVRDFANSLNFPIIMIPWECKFGEVIEEVIYSIQQKNKSQNEIYEKTEKSLLLSYINSKELSEAANIISQLFSLDIIITNEVSEIKGYSRNFKTAPVIEEFAKEHYYTKELVLNKKIYGYIIFLNDKEIDSKDNLELFIDKYAITPLTLWFDKEETINTTILKLKNDFVLRLISNISGSYEDMVADGKRLELAFDLNASYTCIICSATKRQKKSVFDKSVFLNELTVGNIIKKCSIKNSILFAVQENQIIIFHKNTFLANDKSIKSYVAKLNQNLTQSLIYYDFYWGISEFSSENSNFRKLYKNASFALNLCINTSPSELNIITYKDTIVYKIISELTHNEEQLTLAKTTLQPLIDKSKSTDCNLLKTLKIYIENNYNSSKTSRDLSIHRQSLLYRLEKIQELTNMSLDDHTDLYVLETYLRLLYKF